MSAGQPSRCTIRVEYAATDDADSQLYSLTSLARELNDVDGVEASLTSGAESPQGAKGDAVFTAIAASTISGTLPFMLTMLRDWHTRQRRQCKVVLELSHGHSIELSTDTNDATVQAALKKWEAEQTMSGGQEPRPS